MKKLALFLTGILSPTVFILVLAAGPVHASGWSSMGMGLSGNVDAMAVTDDGTLYVGNNRRLPTDPHRADVFSKWNGSTWSDLGFTLRGAILSLAPYGNRVVLGGVFTSIGYRISLWDGFRTNSIGGSDNPGLSTGSVNAIAIDTSALSSHIVTIYAAGDFYSADSILVNNIAMNNIYNDYDRYWSPLGVGIEDDGYVRALLLDDDGNLYVGGDFNEAGGIPMNNIARWDGSSWSDVGGGVNGVVGALTKDSAGNIYVGGSFTTAGGQTVNGIARWDGTNWHPVGTGFSGASGCDIAALVMDGDSNLYAGGVFDHAGGVPANNVAHWNGSQWQALDSGTDDTVRSLCRMGPGKIIVGGKFTHAGGVLRPGIACWSAAPPIIPSSGVGLPLLRLLLAD